MTRRIDDAQKCSDNEVDTIVSEYEIITNLNQLATGNVKEDKYTTSFETVNYTHDIPDVIKVGAVKSTKHQISCNQLGSPLQRKEVASHTWKLASADKPSSNSQEENVSRGISKLSV